MLVLAASLSNLRIYLRFLNLLTDFALVVPLFCERNTLPPNNAMYNSWFRQTECFVLDFVE